MVTATHSSDAQVYGPNGEKVVSLITRLTQMEWFQAVGKQSGQSEAEQAIRECTDLLGIDGYQVLWMTKKELPAFIEGMRLEQSPIWSHISNIPRKIREKAEETGRLDVLSYTIDHVPELLFHSSFQGIFREFEEFGASMVKTAVGFVLYLFGLACAWETLADLEGFESNPFMPLVEVFESGHWPLGMANETFYVL
ncbi:hypothetical protein ACQCN2_15915 [Brevibacillus ginsengisoli]|uniref:hypothetical protein n=1 Tax=Brevibacillus ginsengisoli TaxID=363854 RepID=UPI003CF69A52